MYQVNQESNNITKLEQKKFSELGFREREHLQEWIAKNPDVLGEELLIIQKEYDGFNDTNERLDLLALDKESNLVIIENKLDDTGRDVTWQALKYTSYCSTLSTSQIVKMFQNYLDRYADGEDAKTQLLDFLELESEDDLILNKNDQRMMFIANNYRKEVTSTVLWLINHDINIQCFKATPFQMQDNIFLQIDQIIPVPEVEQFMIDAKEKKQEEKTKSNVAAQTDKLLIEFWKQVKVQFSENGIQYFSNISARAKFNMSFWKGQGRFGLFIGRNTLRVELAFTHDNTKVLFDSMLKYKEEVESKFNGRLQWERLDDKKTSKIFFEMPQELYDEYGMFKDKESWDSKINWFEKAIDEFYKALYPTWEKVQRELN